MGDRDRGVEPAFEDVDENELEELPDVERDPDPDEEDEEEDELVKDELVNELDVSENVDEP